MCHENVKNHNILINNEIVISSSNLQENFKPSLTWVNTSGGGSVRYKYPSVKSEGDSYINNLEGLKMNKAFKVLWNQVRGTYVVASEAQVTHGKPGKATKTIVAAAVAGLLAMGGATQAEEILVDYDYVTSEDQGTTKFISGNGNTLNIQTNADAWQMITEIKDALSGEKVDLDALRQALSQIKEGQETAILFGTTGGSNFYDSGSSAGFQLISEMLSTNAFDNFTSISLEDTPESLTKIGGTSIVIGGKSEPTLLLTVGGDRVVNTGMDLLNNTEYSNFSADLTRVGDVNIVAYSGNLFGLTGASSAINVSGIRVSAFNGVITAGVSAKSTTTILKGNVNVTLDGHTNAAGLLLSGSSIALGGIANSTVEGDSILNISSAHHEDHRLSGVTVGVFGGGLAASTLDGTSTTKTEGKTTINITDGVSVGVFGSGAALSAEIQGAVWDAIKGIEGVGDNIILAGDEAQQKNLLINGGTATVESKGDITVTAGGNSVTVGVAGGGLAMTSSGGTGGTSETYVNTGNITLNIGDETTSEFNDDAKVPLQTTAGNLIDAMRPVLGQLENGFSTDSLSSIFDLVDPVTVAVNEAQASYQGAHVGNVGGSIVIARMPSSAEGTKAIAEATSKDITVNLNAGYSVATLGGGMTVAIGQGVADGTHATSDVTSTTVNVSGGDHVLVMAGGAAYATGEVDLEGENAYKSNVLSQSDVEKATMNIIGGTTDGIFGGGLAIDDTAASDFNASATTKTVEITVSGENTVINKADTTPLLKLAMGESSERPTNGTYVHESADLIGLDHGKAAIVGGGIATGAGATVHSDSVTINLVDGTVNGNVYGGGAATIGGQSTVGTAVIALNGSTVDGDIYGGGLVGSERNNNYANADQYAQASTSVDDVTIELNAGSVKNVYVGGYTYEGSKGVTNSVKTATVRLGAADVFKGEVIDGSDATESSALEITQAEYKFAENQKVIGFNTIAANGSVSGLKYEFGNRDETVVTGGPVEFTSFEGDLAEKALVIGDDTTNTAGFASVVKGVKTDGMTFAVDTGLLSFNETGANAIEIAAAAPTQAVATVYMTGDVDLSNTTVLVGETDNTAPGLYMGANGLLIADAAAKTEVTGTAETAEGAIHFVGVAEDSATVKIAADKETATTVDNVLYKAVQDETGYTFEARTGAELDEVGLGDFDATDMLADLHNHDNKGARFIERFLDQTTVGVTNENRSQQLNAAVNLATAAGVQSAAIDSASLGIDAANKRASIINDQHEGGVLFAEASGRRTEMGGSADFGAIKSELGGVVVGGEYTTGDWTFGALANVGTGSVKGEGDNAGVDNDVDYYGAQIYTGKRFGQFNVVGQVGYLATSNEISHSTVALNKADVDADVITVGVRGEMRFDVTENTRMVPYIGLNYLRVGTDGYTTSQGVQVSDVDQNLLTLPVGVKYAGDMETTSGWMWTPSVDVAYVAAFGDRDVEATTHVGAVGQTTMDVWAESVVRTTIGVKAQKDNFGFGVEAGGAFGSDDTQGLFGQVRVDYRF